MSIPVGFWKLGAVAAAVCLLAACGGSSGPQRDDGAGGQDAGGAPDVLAGEPTVHDATTTTDARDAGDPRDALDAPADARDALPPIDARDAGDAGITIDAAVPPLAVSVVGNTVLSSNATAVTSYDTNVNVASYRQHGLLYRGGYQYVAWYNGNARNAIVARRTVNPTTLAAGAWQWAYIKYALASGADSHNVISMGISEGDGRLHVAFGQHGAQLYYIRSAANAVNGAAWDNTVFGGTGTGDATAAAPSAGMPGYAAATTNVTYPYFVNATTTGAKLQLAYRTGSSGNGEMQLAEYDTGTGQWAYVGQLTSATGSYTQGGVTSNNRNAYPHGFNYDGRGRLHMAFTWRENLSTAFVPGCDPNDTINNHDTLYMYSDDAGRTWKNTSGTTVAATASKTVAGIASPGMIVAPVTVGRDLMNQETQTTDHDNLFHVVVSYVPERYQGDCATDRSQTQPFHLWRAADGSWTNAEIKLAGQDVNQGYDRTKVFVDSFDNLYVLMPDLRVLGASRRTQWTDWRLLYDGRGLGNYGEAIIDHELTRATNSVSVLYLENPNGAPTGTLRVLDLKLGQ